MNQPLALTTSFLHLKVQKYVSVDDHHLHVWLDYPVKDRPSYFQAELKVSTPKNDRMNGLQSVKKDLSASNSAFKDLTEVHWESLDTH